MVRTYKSIIIISAVILSNCLYSQGFDWQWSARLPSENPQTFVGISILYGGQYITGNISFLENRMQCAGFVNGNGDNLSLGVCLEHWDNRSRFAYRGALSYRINSLIATSTDLVPLNPAITAEYENKLTLNYSRIDIKGGVKYRIPTTHLNIGADLLLSFIIEQSFVATEEILGPAEVPPFSTNPPSYKREVLNGDISSLNLFQINPMLSIGYDLQLARGTYFEPNISFIIPVRSMFSDDKVINYIASFGINIYRRI